MLTRTFRRAVWSLILAALLPAAAYCQVLELNLDGTVEGQAAGKKITAELGPGAKFVESAEGQGVEPGAGGPAVKVHVPDELWKSAGTLAFRFRPSRTIRLSPDPKGRKLTVAFIDCPVLHVDLWETKHNPCLRVSVPAEGDYQPKGRLNWSHLKGGRWYHLAFSWDAPNGKLEAYLNGNIQEQIRLRGSDQPWKPADRLSGDLLLGGTLGQGDAAAKIAVDTIRLYPAFMTAEEVAATLRDAKVDPLQGEGLTDYAGALDLTPYKLTLVYEADFKEPLNVISEDRLCEDEKRVRLPEGKDWVFEGPGKAWTSKGQLHMESYKPETGGHIVLWNTRVFPADFLLEFAISPKDSNNGLNIVFFCARPKVGGSIFDLNIPPRRGVFKNYHSGALNSYHISYWACASTDGGTPRRTANLRKNFGFYLPSCGIDRIAGQGPGPHLVRLLKVGGKIQLETCGRLSLVFDDDGKTYGPVWGDGYIGLRQMGHTHRASYTHFKVWKVEPKP